MSHKRFDTSKLLLKPLKERIHDVKLMDVLIPLEDKAPPLDDTRLRKLAQALIEARTINASRLLMYGGHVIRSGCGAYMIELMERGLINHLATNGSGAIHDFEFSLIGESCESVAKYVSQGQFGLWKETGLINDIIKEGLEDDLGAGEAIGRYIWEEKLAFRDYSVLAQAYRLGVPATIHIGIGSDIIHEHPNASGWALGEASYIDFLIYTETISRLEGGVFLNFGSAVTGPEVYLKALAMARNVAHQNNKQIKNFTTAVFDIQDLPDSGYEITPPKTDARYYFRPWKTILARTVADGGKSYYIQGLHRDTLTSLAREALALDRELGHG